MENHGKILKINNGNLDKKQEIHLYLKNKGIKLSDEAKNILDGLNDITEISYDDSNNIEIYAKKDSFDVYFKICKNGDYTYLGEGIP